MKSAFYPFEDRLALIDGKIKPGFATLDPDAGPSASSGSSAAQGFFGDDALID